MQRRTLITHGSLAIRTLQLEAARHRDIGLTITTIGHAAARLAGGFSVPVDNESLRDAIGLALQTTALGELDSIKHLPGAVSAVAETLRKVWLAGMELEAEAHLAPTEEAAARITTIRELERVVKANLPPFRLTPDELCRRAIERLEHAPRVLGNVRVQGLLDVAPVWRHLLDRLAEQVQVTWVSTGGHEPAWLSGSRLRQVNSQEKLAEPNIYRVSAATAYDEVVEAIRWARELLAEGRARPEEIAIATVRIDDYDDYMLALRDDSSLPIHFPHGIPVVTTAAGQAAAALASVLISGPNQSKLRRLARRVGTANGPFSDLPDGWTRVLSTSASLDRPEAWERYLNQLPVDDDWTQENTDHLRGIVNSLQRGTAAAADVGEAFLSGLARQVWRQALATGPASMIDQTLINLRQADGLDPTTSIAWLPASQLTAAPRPYVRLLGLNSGAWPRRSAEDPLLPTHMVSSEKLEPLPTTELDRSHYWAIRRSTANQLALSYARHEAEGRSINESPLISSEKFKTEHLNRHRTPAHALSETDRLLARPEEFTHTPNASRANACWRGWQSKELTPHDGLVRSDHPLILKALESVQSASSLAALIRQPLGFVWRYALRVADPYEEAESLVLDNLAFGSLFHEIVNHAIEAQRKDPALDIAAATELASKIANERWLVEEHTPPLLVWRRQLETAGNIAELALELTKASPPYTQVWTELSFGYPKEEQDSQGAPWDETEPVPIPGTEFSLRGRIDRLDMDEHMSVARVVDFKTGMLPKLGKDPDLIQGKELQRSLYTLAVRSLVPTLSGVEASLVYPNSDRVLGLDDPVQALERLTEFLTHNHESLKAGRALPGPQTEERFEPFALAFPAFRGNYWERKAPAVIEALGPAAHIWVGEPEE